MHGVCAEQELVKTLLQVFEKSKATPYDCVVITRGGGAKTDFLVFDTYSLSRVVARFPIPVITGIGHHKDVSIVDLMAHTQTKTPTKAAEFILAHNRSFEENVLHYQQRLIIRTQQVMANETRKIQAIQNDLGQVVPALLSVRRDELSGIRQTIIAMPRQIISQRSSWLQHTQQAVTNCCRDILHRHDVSLNQVYNRLTGRPRELGAQKRSELRNLIRMFSLYSAQYLRNQQTFLEHQQALMRLMSPENILRKGFAIVSRGDRIITKADQIEVGNEITITLDETNFNTTVNSKTESHGKFDV